ncbi:MAG: type I-C CRISPR-associated protein Cas8c/Csd1 [Hirschia sp.]|nr:type I-C CRISPR-associated protein Cas8c/Csd1 [Hirschia sp.]
MTILASLANAYDRLPDAPPFGYSSEKIGFLISLYEDGTVANVTDWRVGEGAKKAPRPMFVPQGAKRTSGIAPNFLWDKTSYVLGVTAGEGRRLSEERVAFKNRHLEILSAETDPGLVAFRRFLETWTPETFNALGWPEEMKDQNVAFVLESERHQHIRIHERPAARKLWSQMRAAKDAATAACLVDGEQRAIARLHPAIKGVWGGQSSGGSIVAFNAEAYESYGHQQGDNAPVSELAAFKYTTALNIFLGKDSGHRIQIGDASTVVWADASDIKSSEFSEDLFAKMLADDDNTEDDNIQSKRVGEVLQGLREGRPLKDLNPDLAQGMRFYVLGLAPNAARISIRFWIEDDFTAITRNYQKYVSELKISPPPREPYPALWRYVLETATQHKRENIPPKLAGDWFRSILTGTRYPQTLFSTVLMRIRADKDVNAYRVGILKALLIRNCNKKETPVALDPDFTDKGYLLGRLFAVYERIQTAALGNVNATIKDRFYGAASAQPQKVFPLIIRNAQHHLSKLGKTSGGLRHYFDSQIEEIMGLLSPGDAPFPTTLSLSEQALFNLGYYHQRTRKKDDAAQTQETAQ